MKIHKNLKDVWLNYDVFMMAYNTAKERKSYQKTVLKYESNLSQNLEKLITRIETETYKPQPYREFTIHDPKTRIVHAPAFEDRIVHHAILYAIYPLLDKRLIEGTFACRRGKGTLKASKRLQKYLKSLNNDNYVLKIDIEKFFYSISHDRVEYHLNRIIGCKFTTGIIKMFYENESGKGLPLGNATSQLLANLALNPVDHYAKRKLGLQKYIRYMDDIVILHPDKEYLKHCLDELKKVVEGEQLKTNKRTSINKITGGVNFVGFKHFKTNKLVKNKTIHKMKRVIKKYPESDKVISYLAFAKDTNSYHNLCKEFTTISPQFKDKIETFTNRHRKAA